MISDGDEVIIGSPEIKGATVIATCLEEGKAGKMIVFRYKNKVRSRRKTGTGNLTPGCSSKKS